MTRTALLADRIEATPLVFRRGVEQFHHLVCDLGQVHGAERRGSVVRLDLRDSRKRGEHAQHAVEVGQRVADQRLSLSASR